MFYKINFNSVHFKNLLSLRDFPFFEKNFLEKVDFIKKQFSLDSLTTKKMIFISSMKIN